MRSVPFSSAFFVREVADSKEEQELQFWRSQMDALRVSRISWDEFLQEIPLETHPSRFLTTTETGFSLLHLAVLLNRLDLVQTLIDLFPHLKWKRCNLGWTSLELAQFLQRQEILSLFKMPPLSQSFYEQSNLTIPNLDRFKNLPLLNYLHQPLFESDAIFDEILKQTQKAKTEDEISAEKIWMGIYFDKELQKTIHPKVSIRFIDDKVGFGVFAEQKIAPCSFVGEYVGIVKERREKELKGNAHAVRFAGWEMRCKFIIDAEKAGNFTRFINHSANPNLSLQSLYWKGIPRMIFVATQNISEGAQLTFDYGTFFWKECCQTPVVF